MSTLFSTLTQADVVFIGSGVIGMITHYMKSYAKNQTTSTVFNYFGKDNLPATITTLSAFFMACVTALNAGVITPDMNLWAVLYAGMTTGFAVDSGFNGGNTPPKDQDTTK